MQELTEQEIEEVTGGILPLIGFGLALGGKVIGSAGVGGWALSSASLILAAYSAGVWLGDS